MTLRPAHPADAIVVGAGIAGASVACFLAAAGARVTVIEREEQPGMHATGRSAAMFCEGYGSTQVRALTRASRAFLAEPPPGFAQAPLLRRRGMLVIGGAAQAGAVREQHEALRRHVPAARWLEAAALRDMVPVLRPEAAQAGFLDPGAADIEVHELHQGFLHGLRARGGRVECGVRVQAIERAAGKDWEVVDAAGRRWCAPLLVNAAGAWVDEVAALAGVAPIGIQPRRRTAFVFAPPPGMAVGDWPLVIGADEGFYFKPDAGALLGSPANADPVAPQDVQPEELDVALGIHRIEQATTLRIRRPGHTWAGLRSFVADGDLVGGFAPDAPGFLWVAAQGGYGIQTCAAMGEACAALALGRPLPARLQDEGLGAAQLSPARLRAPRG